MERIMTQQKMVSLLLECTLGHEFWLDVERKEDVEMSHVSDVNSPEGYAIFRDRSLIKCGPCAIIGDITYCRLVPCAMMTLQVKHTPNASD
jgi:hypothetical protein